MFQNFKAFSLHHRLKQDTSDLSFFVQPTCPLHVHMCRKLSVIGHHSLNTSISNVHHPYLGSSPIYQSVDGRGCIYVHIKNYQLYSNCQSQSHKSVNKQAIKNQLKILSLLFNVQTTAQQIFAFFPIYLRHRCQLHANICSKTLNCCFFTVDCS